MVAGNRLLSTFLCHLTERCRVVRGAQLAEYLDRAADAQHRPPEIFLACIQLRLKTASRLELRAELRESLIDEVSHVKSSKEDEVAIPSAPLAPSCSWRDAPAA